MLLNNGNSSLMIMMDSFLICHVSFDLSYKFNRIDDVSVSKRICYVHSSVLLFGLVM